MDVRIDSIISWFNRISLGGIPQLIRDETAFLSFVCMLAGIEALAGYHNPNASGPSANGERFRRNWGKAKLLAKQCNEFPRL